MPIVHSHILYPPSSSALADNRQIFAHLKKDALFKCHFSDDSPKTLFNKLSKADTLKVGRASRVIQGINSELTGGKTRRLIVVDGEIRHGHGNNSGYLNGMMVVPYAPVIFIPLSECLSGSAPLKMGVTHEATHIFFLSLPVGTAKPILQAYQSIMELIGLPAWPTSLHYELFGDKLYHEATAVFAEETYCSGAKGHPYAGEEELFSSLTAIIRHSFGSFSEKVDKFTSPAQKQLALQAMKATVSAWGSARIFADEVYQKLGLPIPAEKEEVASSART